MASDNSLVLVVVAVRAALILISPFEVIRILFSEIAVDMSISPAVSLPKTRFPADVKDAISELFKVKTPGTIGFGTGVVWTRLILVPALKFLTVVVPFVPELL